MRWEVDNLLSEIWLGRYQMKGDTKKGPRRVQRPEKCEGFGAGGGTVAVEMSENLNHTSVDAHDRELKNLIRTGGTEPACGTKAESTRGHPMKRA